MVLQWQDLPQQWSFSLTGWFFLFYVKCTQTLLSLSVHPSLLITLSPSCSHVLGTSPEWLINAKKKIFAIHSFFLFIYKQKKFISQNILHYKISKIWLCYIGESVKKVFATNANFPYFFSAISYYTYQSLSRNIKKENFFHIYISEAVNITRYLLLDRK